MIQVSDMKGLLYGQVFFHVVTGFIGCWFVRGTSLNEESSFDMFHAEDRLVFAFKNSFTGYTIEKSERYTFSHLLQILFCLQLEREKMLNFLFIL